MPNSRIVISSERNWYR